MEKKIDIGDTVFWYGTYGESSTGRVIYRSKVMGVKQTKRADEDDKFEYEINSNNWIEGKRVYLTAEACAEAEKQRLLTNIVEN